jgi:hypothetical protein
MKRILLFGVALLCASGTALAFPPAPNHTLYGVVRDEMGDPVMLTNAVVTFETTAGIKIVSYVNPNLGDGINYRLRIPMDAGVTSDNYKTNAQRASALFRVTVAIGSTTFVPIQMQGSMAQLGKPAGMTRLDLTFGKDSTGDGIPDAWKQMILEMSGGLYTNINQIHADGRFPGHSMTFRQCYIAGTYPWDPNDVFSLRTVGNKDGIYTLEFNAIKGRTYTIMGSSNLKEWTPITFRLNEEGANGSLRGSYQAGDSRTLQIDVPPQGTAPTVLFFNAVVQ